MGPLWGQPLSPEVDVLVLGGGEDVGGGPTHTPNTHLTDPRWVLRGAGPSLRAWGGGRSHVHVLGTPSLGQVRPSRVSSSLPLRACGVRAHSETRVLLGDRRRSAVAAIARGELLPKPTYLPTGCCGVMARRVGCGLDRRHALSDCCWWRGEKEEGSFSRRAPGER